MSQPISKDYRALTDYRPSTDIISKIMKQNNISDSYDLKDVLTHNGGSFRKLNTSYYAEQTNASQSFIVPDPFNIDVNRKRYISSLKK